MHGSFASLRMTILIFISNSRDAPALCPSVKTILETPLTANPVVRPSVGTWLSLVEHSLGVRGVGSSNLPVPTNNFNFNGPEIWSEDSSTLSHLPVTETDDLPGSLSRNRLRENWPPHT